MDMISIRRKLMAKTQNQPAPTEYVLDVVDGVVHPISVPVYVGQKIKIYWSDVTVNDYTTQLYQLINGASFAETTGKSRTTIGIGQAGNSQYTIASDGSIVIGGKTAYPNTLWDVYALRGKVTMVIT